MRKTYKKKIRRSLKKTKKNNKKGGGGAIFDAAKIHPASLTFNNQ
jgi:hypothetical protein